MRFLIFLCLITLMFSVRASQLLLSKTNLEAADTLSVNFSLEMPQTGDLYLAIQLSDSSFYFLTLPLTLTLEAKPFWQNIHLSGNYELLSVPARIIPAGHYTLYAVVVTPGGNPYNFQEWLEGESGLKYVPFTVQAPPPVNLDDLCIPPEKWHAEMSHCMVM